MYIFKNAFKSLVRAKGRNLLIALIVLVLSVSSCIGLSIKRANENLKTEYANDKEITATLTSTKPGAMMQGIPLETLNSYAENELVKDFSLSASLYFAAGDGIEPLDVSGSFEQNRDFRDKYGDVKNGEKITSSTSSSTTSTETTASDESSSDTAKTEGVVTNLSATASGKVLLLNNTASTPAEQESQNSQNGEAQESPSTQQPDTENPDVTDRDSQQQEGGISDSQGGNITDTDPSAPTINQDGSTEKGETQTPEESEKENSATSPSKDKNTEQGEETKDQQSPTSGKGTASTNQGSDNSTKTQPPTPPENNQSGKAEGVTKPENIEDGGRGGNTYITHKNEIINNQFFFNMASMNDFTVTGYNSEKAMPDYVSELGVLDLNNNSRNCVISKALAEENELEVGDKFKLANPNNEDETYKFTIVGICNTAQSGDSTDTSSNASFVDNYIHISGSAIDKIVASSEKKNATNEESTDEEETEKSNALSPIYSGTYSFRNRTDYDAMSQIVNEDNYTLVSADVENYEKSVKQLNTLSGYATYFLVVIFVIGAIVLIIINLFSIRDRKYEIGVLTAIGMKKRKVATQFVIELFCITFSALIIGSSIGAVSSVPVTNGLLTAINSPSAEASETISAFETPEDLPEETEKPSMPDINRGNKGNMNNQFQRFMGSTGNYIASITSATDITVIGQMILVGLGLTLISALSAVLFVMRYEPLKILSNRE